MRVLAWPALAQEDHVVAGEQGVLELRHDGVLVAEDPLEQRLAGGDPARRRCAGSPPSPAPTSSPTAFSSPSVVERAVVMSRPYRRRSPPTTRRGRVARGASLAVDGPVGTRGGPASPTTSCAAAPSASTSTTTTGRRSRCPATGAATPAFADSDGPLLYRTRFELEPRRRTASVVRHARRRLLPGRRLARRRLPRRPRGLLLPAQLRHHRPVAPRRRARARGRGRRARRSATANAKRNITGVFQHWDCIDPTWNPGGLWRPVRIETTGPVRIDRCRVLCRDANDARAHLRLARPARQRRAAHGADPHLRRRRRCSRSSEQSLARRHQRGRLEPRHRRPAAVVAVVARRPAADRRRRSRCSSTARSSDARTGAHRAARGRAAGLGVLRQRRAAVREGRQPRPDPARRSARPRRPSSAATSSSPATPASTCCACTATSRGPSCTTPPTSSACCVAGLPAAVGIRPHASARRRCARRARPSTCSATIPSIVVWCGHNEPVASTSSERRRRRGGARYIAGQQLPTWNRTILDRWVKRAFEKADETPPVIAHSGVVPHLPQLDGTDSHLVLRLGPRRRARPRRLRRDDAAHGALRQRVRRPGGARRAPTSCEPKRWPDLDWDAPGSSATGCSAT